MTCEELRDSYELHALGLTTGEERAELEAHLQRGCAQCIRGVREAAETASLVALSASEQEPPAELRRRILEAVRPSSAKVVSMPVRPAAGKAWLPWAVAAALLLGSFWFFKAERDRSVELAQARQDLTAAREALASSRVDLARFQELFTILDQAETKVVSFGDDPTPRGRVLVNPQAGVVLIASRLPQLPTGRTFQMWLIPKGGAAPQPAGLFQAAQGRALHRLSTPVNLATIAAVAVSVEPDGGSPAPTTTPISVIPLG